MKKQITLRVDEDVLDWFRGRGKGYQSHINKALRFYVDNFTQSERVVQPAPVLGKISKSSIKRAIAKKVEDKDPFFKPMPKGGKK